METGEVMVYMVGSGVNVATLRGHKSAVRALVSAGDERFWLTGRRLFFADLGYFGGTMRSHLGRTLVTNQGSVLLSELFTGRERKQRRLGEAVGAGVGYLSEY